MKLMNPIHPGEILMQEFLSPLGLSEKSFAQASGVSESLIEELIAGRAGITANLALGFSDYFGNSVEFWMNLQSRYELETEKDRAQG
jgi:addiction module HigA family antidote